MTEQQARDAKRLIEELDRVKRLPEQIHAQYRKAVDGDKDAAGRLANVGLELAEELAQRIAREIASL